MSDNVQQKMNPHTLIGLGAGMGMVILSVLLYLLPPEGYVVSPLLLIMGTLAGLLVAGASWVGRHQPDQG